MPDTTPTPNDAAAATPAAPAMTKVEDLPDWAQKEITDTRAEAAKYRVEKNEAVDTAVAAAQVKFQEQLDAASNAKTEVESKLAGAILETSKLKAALGAGIPADKVVEFSDLLKGDTDEELKSHATELKKLFNVDPGKPSTVPAVDPSQGSGNESLPLNGDPLVRAVEAIVRR